MKGKKILANVAVGVVLLWMVVAVVGVIAQQGEAQTATQTVAARALMVLIVGSTALAYVIVIRQAASAVRWAWFVVVAFLLAIVGWQTITGPIIGTAGQSYSGHDVLTVLAVWLTIATPLVWFRLRPVRPKPQPATQS